MHEPAMSSNIVLSNLLSLNKTRVVRCEFTERALVLDVKPTFLLARCSGCGRKVRRVYDTYRGRTWRHMDFGGMEVHLRCDLRRVDCRRCGVLVELVPWADHGSTFTHRFEHQVAFLAQHASRTVVSEVMRIAWRTVGNVIRRVVARAGRRDLLSNLRRIGVDELSYRRHHEYITVVIDHDTGRIVWARPGRSAATLEAFFDQMGAERCARLENVTIDMSQAYESAARRYAPNATIVFDRFHVQRLVHDALDALRRSEVNAAGRGSVAATSLKRTRWALQKNPWNLTEIEAKKLTTLQKTNKRLYRGYLLKESLAAILDGRNPDVAHEKLIEWCRWATRSRLAPFARASRTIRSHVEGIVAYIQTGLSNGRTEGLNGKARTITRRAFGFHHAHSLIAMLFLCCSGLALPPVHVFPSRITYPR